MHYETWKWLSQLHDFKSTEISQLNIIYTDKSGSCCNIPLLHLSGTKGWWWNSTDLRSFKVGQEQLNALQRTKKSHKSAKLHGNQLKAPLLIDSDERNYVDIAKPSALYLKLAANHIVDELMKLWPECKMLTLSKKMTKGERETLKKI